MDELWGIGRLARASGLTVSALRFYDGADVLTPAVVDPHTGYRRVTSDPPGRAPHRSSQYGRPEGSGLRCRALCH